MIDPMRPVEEKIVLRVLNEAKTHGWTTVSVVFNDHKIVDIQCQNHVSPSEIKKMYQMPIDSFRETEQ
jgi:hypothetical protein